MAPLSDPYEALQLCIQVCAKTDNRHEIHKAVVAAITAAVEMDRGIPSFLSFEDPCVRWGLQRKAIERFDLPRIKLGGSIRFSRDDVLAFEQLHRSTTERIPSG